MTPAEHHARALALAEAATDPHDVAAFQAVAAAWKRLGQPPSYWSHAPAQRALAQLQADCQQPLPAAQPIHHGWPPTEGDTQRQIGDLHHVPTTTITF